LAGGNIQGAETEHKLTCCFRWCPVKTLCHSLWLAFMFEYMKCS